MSEELLLKWNDHHNLFFVGAEELCEGEEYTDVTLAAGTKFFPAHKLVLSICSPYFRQLFKHLVRDKPVIFLKDVDPEHLHLLIQYMYKGEIKVQESELVHVLSLAQDLEIKGLSDPNSANNKGQLASKPKIKQCKAIDSGSKKNNLPIKKNQSSPITDRCVLNSSDPVREEVPVKQAVLEDLLQHRDEHLVDDSTAYNDDDDIEICDGPGQDIAYVDTSVVSCYGNAEHYSKAMGELDDQDVGWTVPGKHASVTNVICNYCGKEYRHMSALKNHLPVHTGEKRFECAGCGRRFTQISSMNKHMKIKNCSPQLNPTWSDSL